MVFKYSKYGLISGLIFLIPIFPIWTFIPMVVFTEILGEHYLSCETKYKIICLLSLIFAIILDCIYIANKIGRKSIRNKNEFSRFFIFSLLLYSLLNFFGFITFVGVKSACYGDGQVLLGALYSGPIASLAIFINGIIIDVALYLNRKKIITNETE